MNASLPPSAPAAPPLTIAPAQPPSLPAPAPVRPPDIVAAWPRSAQFAATFLLAVFLGWLVLHEPVTGYIFAGSAVVIASVILVTSASVKTVAEEMPAVETAGD